MLYQKIIRVHNDIKIDFDSISSAKSECAALNLNTEGLFKVFSSEDRVCERYLSVMLL